MSNAANTNEEPGKLDLVPMIDCVMLLLFFFILTSSFRSEEQRISALLSTQGGGIRMGVEQPKVVRVVVVPGEGRSARVRVGGGEEFALDGVALTQRGGPGLEAAITAFHAAIADHLVVYEQPGTRCDQPAVEIHCATRLPWRDALTVYDAVRGYEAGKLPYAELALAEQRQVSFGAPLVRRSPGDDPTVELERLDRLR